MNKQFTVIHGPRENEILAAVELNGVSEDEPLTPKMAVRAATVACGHRNGVTVQSGDGHFYRLYKNTHRKYYFEN